FKDRKISIFGEKILRCDRELISLLLYNLCQNALKYSDDEVIIKLSKSGIFVRDFGVGFDKNEKNLLFKKFYKSSKFKHSGSLGFGLWACNQICKMHDFKLLANSTPKGTTFGVVC
ncbi:MAG: ATP-binding protein, partial [Campylobacter sp.]|nr:ATP-binding protein [Campylobacter sp.]